VEPPRGAEDRLALADVDLAIVDEEGLAGRCAALPHRLVGGCAVRDGGLAAADGAVERGALPVVSVTDGLLRVVAHRITSLASRMRCSAKRCIADPGTRCPSSSRVPGLRRITACCAAPGTGHRHHFPSGVFNSSGKYFNTLISGFGAAWPRPQIEASRISADSSVKRPTSHGPRSINLTAFSVPTRQGVHWPQLSSSKNFKRLSATAFMSSLSDRMTTACEPTKLPNFSRVPKSSGISAIDSGRMPPDGPPGRKPLKAWPSCRPPQNSSISSRMVMPAGASFTPGFLTRPETEKLRKPLRSWRP